MRTSFYKGYKELVGKDFFGIKGKNVNELALIDRINLITKIGQSSGVNFSDEEMFYYDWAEKCKTWDEVVECAQAIYDWSKENETRNKEDDAIRPSSLPDFDDEDLDDDEEGMEWDGQDYESNDGFGEESDSESSDGGDSEIEDDNLPDEDDMDSFGGSTDDDWMHWNNDEESDEKSNPAESKRGGEGSSGSFEHYYDDKDGARESLTEHNAHNNEDMFVEDAPIVRTTKDLKPHFQNPKDIDIVVPVEKLTAINEKYLKENNYDTQIAMDKHTVQKILDKNKSLIAHMAKEFEMKQNAMRSAKAFQGKTGKLDMNALAKYQVIDDIFKRVTYIPDGKNHGVVVLLDWSGSIWSEVKNLLEQSLILAEFCKKVNIPYRVFLFSDSFLGQCHDPELRSWYEEKNGHATLLEIFRNNMKKPLQNSAYNLFGNLYNQYITADIRSWDKSYTFMQEWFGDIAVDRYDMHCSSASCFSLGGTPLNASLLSMRKFLPEFRSAYQLEKVILTVITDGFSHESSVLRVSSEEYDDIEEQEKSIRDGSDEFVTRGSIEKQISIQDPYSNKIYPYQFKNKEASNYSRNDFQKTSALLDWLSKETKCIVTGYFCLGSKRDFYPLLNCVSELREKIEEDYGYDDGYRKTWSQIRKEGLVVQTFGYNKLFLTANSNLAPTNDELSDDLIGAKKATLLSNFKKNQKGKTGSRFLTNEFIKEIS